MIQTRNSLSLRRALVDDMKATYGGAMKLCDVMNMLGLKDQRAAKAWLERHGVEAINVNDRNRWLTIEVARAIDMARRVAS